jgi:class 3 adenylate cyclase
MPRSISQYTAVGETTHRAARLPQLARPGGVVCAGATVPLAQDFPAMRPLARSPTNRAITQLLLREALHQPLVVLVEDLHWIWHSIAIDGGRCRL